MPFTVSPSSYQGGQYLFSGLSSLGSSLGTGIGKAFDEVHKAEEEEAADQIIINFARQNKLIEDEDYAKFLAGSRTQKAGITAGIVRKLSLDSARQQLQAQNEARQALAEQRRAAAEDRQIATEQRKFAGQPVWLQNEKGDWHVIGVHDAKGSPILFKGGETEGGLGVNAVNIPDPDDPTKRIGVGVTYGKQFHFQPEQGQGIPQVDGQYGYYDNGGHFRAYPWQQQILMRKAEEDRKAKEAAGAAATGAQATPAPAQGGSTSVSPVNQAWDYIQSLFGGRGGGGGTPAPSGSAPSATPAQGKQLTRDKAQEYFLRAGRDPQKAAQMARADGYYVPE